MRLVLNVHGLIQKDTMNDFDNLSVFCSTRHNIIGYAIFALLFT